MKMDIEQLIQSRIIELRENTDFVSILFYHLTGYAIIVADFDGNIITYNKGAHEIFGYVAEEVIGKKNIETFFPNDFVDAGGLQQVINDLIKNEKYSYEGVTLRKNGDSFPAQIDFSLIKNDDDEIFGFIEILQDITLRKQYEEARQQQIREQELEMSLENQRRLTGWEKGATTAQMAGIGPLSRRNPDVFNTFLAEYETLLDKYLECLGFNESPPRRAIAELASQLGYHSSGPRDIVDIHIRAVTEKSGNVSPKRAQVYVQEGRLLALEVMGYLVDYYRMG